MEKTGNHVYFKAHLYRYLGGMVAIRCEREVEDSAPP